jgi:hypothetical protein
MWCSSRIAGGMSSGRAGPSWKAGPSRWSPAGRPSSSRRPKTSGPPSGTSGSTTTPSRAPACLPRRPCGWTVPCAEGERIALAGPDRARAGHARLYARRRCPIFVDVDGLRYGFVGDLIYGDGRLLDLYSLQDAVPQARIGGYHGYAGRIGDHRPACGRWRHQKPDVLVPARGPVIREPPAAIDRLIAGSRRPMRTTSRSVRGAGTSAITTTSSPPARWAARIKVPWMPYAGTIEKTPPDWIVPIHNSRLVLARDGLGVCSSIAGLGRSSTRSGSCKPGTAGLARRPVHHALSRRPHGPGQRVAAGIGLPGLRDTPPGGPAPTAGRLSTALPDGNAIDPCSRSFPDGHRMTWKEFSLTFYDFPGQTIYHSALLVERDTGEKIFFIGRLLHALRTRRLLPAESQFAPQGMGYFYCLDLLKQDSAGRPADQPARPGALPLRCGSDRHMEQALMRARRSVARAVPLGWTQLRHRRAVGAHPPVWPGGPSRRWANLAVKTLQSLGRESTVAVTLERAGRIRGRAGTRPRRGGSPPGGADALPHQGWPPARRFHPRRHGGHPDRPWDLRHWCEGLLKIVP